MKIAFIVALTRNERVIGRQNALPWSLPEDLKRFRSITLGHPIIMGRKTFDSIGKPLPQRRNIVITSQKELLSLDAKDVEYVSSLEQGLKLCAGTERVFVIGGAQVFKAYLDRVDELYLTWIDKDFSGDVFFPEIDLTQFKLLSEHCFDEPFRHCFSDYVRK